MLYESPVCKHRINTHSVQIQKYMYTVINIFIRATYLVLMTFVYCNNHWLRSYLLLYFWKCLSEKITSEIKN